jgi:hypothetical protein
MWLRVRDAIAGALDSITLADLVPPAARLGGDVAPSPALRLNPAGPAGPNPLAVAD